MIGLAKKQAGWHKRLTIARQTVANVAAEIAAETQRAQLTPQIALADQLLTYRNDTADAADGIGLALAAGERLTAFHLTPRKAS